MRLSPPVLALSLLSASLLHADTIPYGNPGTLSPGFTLTAANTGDIVGYFAGQSAGDDSVIRLVDVTSGYTSGWFFANHSTATGTSANFGSVTAGDSLVFELYNKSLGMTFATDAAHSDDGINHGYEASFSGGMIDSVSLPAGVYIGMEDLPNGGDFDYNDNTFLFTNVGTPRAVGTTPEPGSLVLLGTGILGAAGAIRRRLAIR